MKTHKGAFPQESRSLYKVKYNKFIKYLIRNGRNNKSVKIVFILKCLLKVGECI